MEETSTRRFDENCLDKMLTKENPATVHQSQQCSQKITKDVKEKSRDTFIEFNFSARELHSCFKEKLGATGIYEKDDMERFDKCLERFDADGRKLVAQLWYNQNQG